MAATRIFSFLSLSIKPPSNRNPIIVKACKAVNQEASPPFYESGKQTIFLRNKKAHVKDAGLLSNK